MTEKSVAKIDLGGITKEIFDELIDKKWRIWGKPDKSFDNTLLFSSIADYRVQLTYIEMQQNYMVIIQPRRNIDFSSMEEVENTLNNFIDVVINGFNEKYKTNVHICIEDTKDNN